MTRFANCRASAVFGLFDARRRPMAAFAPRRRF